MAQKGVMMMTLLQPLQPPEIQQGLLHPGYFYQEYRPAIPLRQVIACYWSSYAAPCAASLEHRVIPDGCIDIIFDLMAEQVMGSAFISRLMCRYEIMPIDQPMHCFGVRMYAGEAMRILGLPAGSLYGCKVTLQNLYGSAADSITEQIICAENMTARISLLDHWLCRKLEQQVTVPASLFTTALQYIHSERGNITLPGLADELHYSERTIRRLFQQQLGISPKEISGIIRFQSLLYSWQRQSAFPLSMSRYRFSDLAAAHGYYDQSHLNRAFKQYYGLAPGQVIQSSGNRAETLE
ncbi:DUF6597 domain-containing transcriptional factor [Paenibacillus sp. Z6-24]